jgi:hypothetical protein
MKERYYLEFSEETRWFGYIYANSVEEASKEADLRARELKDDLVSIHRPISVYTLYKDTDGAVYDSTIDRIFNN